MIQINLGRVQRFAFPSTALTFATVASLFAVAPSVRAETIKVDGSSTVFPITSAVAEEFQKTNQAKVIVGVSGTGGGFKKFCAGETHISNASRFIKDKEIELCKQGGVEFIELAVAYDALTVVVNKNNDWVNSMSIAELKSIWHPDNQASVKSWSDVKSNWPSARLNLYGPGTDSGTFDYFTEKINGKTQLSRTDYTASEDDNILVQGVVRDKHAMAYFGYAYYEENKDRLKAIAIDGGEGNGPVLPSRSSVENGSYSPLSRPIFIYVNKNALKEKSIKSFVQFYLGNTSRLAADVGYVPLSQADFGRSQENFKKKVTGRTFSAKK